MDVLIDNHENLSRAAIISEFCRFGAIQDIKQSGPVYVFIHFKTEAAAQNCLKEMENHRTYNARQPIRSKSNRKSVSQKDEHKYSPRQSLTRNLEDEGSSDLNARMTQMSLSSHDRNNKKPTLQPKTSGNLKNKNGFEINKKTTNNKNNKGGDDKSDMDGCCPFCNSRLPAGIRQPFGYNRPLIPSSVLSDSEGPTDAPKLVFIQDELDYENMMSQPEIKTVGVLISNFPLYFLQCDIYDLCNQFSKVLHVEIYNKMTPLETPYALVFVANEDEATYLIEHLHGTMCRGKTILAFRASDWLEEYDP